MDIYVFIGIVVLLFLVYGAHSLDKYCDSMRALKKKEEKK